MSSKSKNIYLNNDHSGPDNDGPYVSYEGDKIIVRTIGSDLICKTESYSLSAREKIILNCSFSEKDIPDFSTRLKRKLQTESSVHKNAKKILAMSDIEGNFRAFRTLLLANGVIDNDYNWIFGEGQLVLNGDFFDRGRNVTEVLWLIYDLEDKAKTAGGYVHFILGNHELMVMSGDYRYVPRKYFENQKLHMQELHQLYTHNTELGRWLLTKNIIEIIGGILFVHAGISEGVNKINRSIDELNELCRPWYCQTEDVYLADDAEAELLLDSFSSPFWYRGYVLMWSEQKEIDETLKKFGVSHIVVGHTMVKNISALFNKKVIAIDTDHAKGISQALLIEDEKLFAVDGRGERKEL